MIRHVKRWLTVTFLAACGLARAAPPPPDLVPLSLARDIALRTIELVESKALPPRQAVEFTRARAAVLAMIGGDTGSERIERGALFARIKAMLDTLDADGHSFILPPAFAQYRNGLPMAGADAPRFAVVDTPAGKVLHWTPPQIVDMSVQAKQAWMAGFEADAAGLPGIASTCALVVDLSAQQGGNAWPTLAAMYPLFSTSNRAVMVDRDGRRIPLADPEQLRQEQRRLTGDDRNPLARFAGLPYGVVVDRSTSSAGEMLLVALLGEGERGQTFGSTSHGMSTVNMTYPLPGGATLVLTEMRYAVGDAAQFRGGIPARHPALPGESRAAIVQRAARWAAGASPMCKAPPVPAIALK